MQTRRAGALIWLFLATVAFFWVIRRVSGVLANEQKAADGRKAEGAFRGQFQTRRMIFLPGATPRPDLWSFA